MPLTVDAITYYTMKDAVDLLSITRQTLWRWRREGKVPQGRLFRRRRLLFSQSEFGQIEAFANKMESLPVNRLQLSFLNDAERQHGNLS